MTSHYNIWTNPKFSESIEIIFLEMHPNFRPRTAFNEPARSVGRAFLFHLIQPQNMRPGGTAGPRGKGMFMTFDRERYRAHIAPLKLTREKEDELLDDLWLVAEALYDLSPSAPTYPLQMSVAHQAFDALKQAIAVESGHTQTETEAP